MFSFTYTFGQQGYFGEPNIAMPLNTAPAFPSSPAVKKDTSESIPPPVAQEVKKSVPKKTAEPKKITEPKTDPVLILPVAKDLSKPAAVKNNLPVKKSVFVLVAGTHGRLESAKAEAHTLELLKIKSFTQAMGNKYRVVIGRYDSLKKAQKAAKSYAKKGYRFEIVEE